VHKMKNTPVIRILIVSSAGIMTIGKVY